MVCTEKTATYVMHSPIGDIQLVVCQKGLHSSSQIISTDDDFCPYQKQQVKIKSVDIDDQFSKHVKQTVMWFRVYFSNYFDLDDNHQPKLCMDSIQSVFRKNVWMTLAQNTQPGETTTYGGLMTLMHSKGFSGCAQAVGSALAVNPFQIIVPCHRVLPKSGEFGQYAKGKKNKVKEWLLKYEGVGCCQKRKQEHSFGCEDCVSMEIGPKKIRISTPCQKALSGS
ncbi:hypothetical protein R5R35_002795 [Gryllus longicercus]|uniref:Methylated-DNA--protein-cysteine methyltransferase n=1 Tax=Gryllus longicercus TaxID=2509291 RepID=A0AAN9V0S9_9ORTH